jgi:hypothetical protein
MRCLQAIDFGRAIDLQLLPAGTQFEGVSTTEGMQCPEMLSGKPWHYCVRFPCSHLRQFISLRLKFQSKVSDEYFNLRL